MGSDLLFVNGTLMRGLALNRNLDGADFVEEARTAPVYRIYSIGDVHPGMFEVADTTVVPPTAEVIVTVQLADAPPPV